MKLARVFSDHMVLQRQRPICIWGTCDAAQTVAVRLDGREICRESIEPGDFTLLLPAQEAAEDVLLEIGDIRLEHVDIGEVWVAGGQSNMEFMMQYDAEGDAEIAAAADPHLRTYIVGQYSWTGEREAGYKAWNPWDRWLTWQPENAPVLPATAIYFAKELRAQGIPVGILSCNWGGTSAAAWTDRAVLEADPVLRVYPDEFDRLTASLDLPRFQAIRDAVRRAMASPESQKARDMIMKTTHHPSRLEKMMMAAAQKPQEAVDGPSSAPEKSGLAGLPREELMREGPGDKSEPGSLYTNMLLEIAGYTARGVIWYQGETDENKAELYARLFGTMIGCWRQTWQKRDPAQEKLPFLFVQLAPYGIWMTNTSVNYPELRRQQQLAADTVPDVWMTSIGDVGNVYDIHPKEKRPVGHRLALLARKYIYGEDLLADAPGASGAEREADAVRIRFENGTGLHLVPRDFTSYNGFAAEEIEPSLLPPVLGGVGGLCVLAGGAAVEDAGCSVEADALVIRSPAFRNAAEIRIEFAQTPFYQVNLLNGAEIPVKPFVLTV